MVDEICSFCRERVVEERRKNNFEIFLQQQQRWDHLNDGRAHNNSNTKTFRNEQLQAVFVERKLFKKRDLKKKEEERINSTEELVYMLALRTDGENNCTRVQL